MKTTGKRKASSEIDYDDETMMMIIMMMGEKMQFACLVIELRKIFGTL